MDNEPSTALAPVEPPGAVMTLDEMMAADAGKGQDFKGDIAIPFLVVLQPGSPQVNPAHQKFVDGAQAGMIMNNVTREVTPSLVLPGKAREGLGMTVIRAAYQLMVVEWIPRGSGGGFVAQHLPESPFVAAGRVQEIDTGDGKKRKITVAPNGNWLVETGYHYVITVKGEQLGWAVIGMSGTQRKVTRAWNLFSDNQVFAAPDGTKKKAPIYGLQYQLTTKAESNKDGTWFGWDFACLGKVTSIDAYKAARDYADAINTGRARATAPPTETGEAKAPEGDEDVPF